MPENNPKKYNFLLQGNRDEAVLLVHGITGTPSEMRYFGKGLHKAGFTVFCNTLPRHCSTLGELKKVTWQEIVAACSEDFKRLKKEYPKVTIAGISVGALVGLHLAHQYPGEVNAVVALAPTLFYDGWAVKKTIIFMHIGWHIPFLRNMVDIRESWPYGLKDEDLRWSIERFYKGADARKFSNKVLLFGSPFFPVASLYQHHLLKKVVEKELPSIKTPTLILHAREDDMTSIKNAEYIYGRIGSEVKSLVLLEDSYHMITIDKDKDRVIQETVNFLNKL